MLENLSKYRSQLMGFAIMYVIVYHFYGITLVAEKANGLFSLGYLGVDVFMFCSGFGLACNYINRLASRNDILNFYKKRVLRILPTYYVAVILHIFVAGLCLIDALWNLTIFSFYYSKPFFDWYIPSALILYALFPLYCRGIRSRGIIISTIIPILIGLLLTFSLVYIGKGSQIMFFGRIPIFFIGCLFGYFYNLQKHGDSSKDTIFKVLNITLAVLAVIFCFLQYYNFTHYDMLYLHRHSLLYLPFALIIPSFCVAFTSFMGVLSRIRYIGSAIIWLLGLLGGLSLELYLLHIALPTHGFHFIVITYALAYPLKKCGEGVSFIIKRIFKTSI